MGFELAENAEGVVNIKVIGCGGGGCNAINRMINSGVQGVEFVAANTDLQVINSSRAEHKIQMGQKMTKGLGAGSDPSVGEKSATESKEEFEQLLQGTDMVFITAGMGGGTGTGSAPVVAEIAKNMGILTVAIVTKPFNFEGKFKMKNAEAGIAKLREKVDSLIVIPNEKLKEVSQEKITLLNAFQIADEVLRQGVQSISDLILTSALINLDFADVSKIMKDAGNAHMGVGRANGKDKAELAAAAAISSPLLETTIAGATGVIINITASPDIGLDEVDTASHKVIEAADPNANIIWGVALNNDLEDKMIVTVIATGFQQKKPALKLDAVEAAPAEPADLFSAPAATPVEPQTDVFAAPAPAEEPAAEEGGDDFDLDDVFDFFKKK
ncbi:MAG: cell division protein FtsZ [Clostridia bacterium]|nr:cell division protein FtsZ [Clostridia bacterium]